MKKIIIGLLITALVTAVILSAGCVDNGGNAGNDERTITVTDAVGRTVTIPDNPQKIAVSGSGALRYFVYLNIPLDRVVIVDDYDSKENTLDNDRRPYRLAHPEMLTIPAIGSKTQAVDYEKLMKSGAEVLFLSTFAATYETAEEITSKTGVPVVMFYTGDYVNDVDKIHETFRLIGGIFHNEKRTEELIKYFTSVEEDLKSRIPKGISESEKPTVYIAGVAYRGGHGIEGTDPYYYPFTVLGAKNVAGDIGFSQTIGYAEIAKEQLLEWDPDIIFIDLSTLHAKGGGAIHELKTDRSYQQLTAVKNGQVYTVNPHTSFCVNFETTLANAYYIGKILYPEQFTDIDPAEKADEIYKYVDGGAVYNQLKTNLQGLSYTKLEI
ncbi:MAG TPA: ABC transporter substrate-binding protein [Methanocorpusculum sp.]|nr:ABC transporter substrate-binding protein [Methanocorpusculum sp.]